MLVIAHRYEASAQTLAPPARLREPGAPPGNTRGARAAAVLFPSVSNGGAFVACAALAAASRMLRSAHRVRSEDGVTLSAPENGNVDPVRVLPQALRRIARMSGSVTPSRGTPSACAMPA
jgi:hypothetical protein